MREENIKISTKKRKSESIKYPLSENLIMSEDYYDPNDSDESLENANSREDSLDNDEISAEEEGFLKGYDDAQEEKKAPSSEEEEEI